MNKTSFDYGVVTYKHRYSIYMSLDGYEETTLNGCVAMIVLYKYKTTASDTPVAEMQIVYKDENDHMQYLCKDLHDFTFTIKHKGDMQIDL